MPTLIGFFILYATFSNFAAGQLVDLILKNEENVADDVRNLINDKGKEIVDEVNESGWSPISAAMDIENLEVVEILVNHGAKLNVKMEIQNQYPLHNAIEIGWLPAVKLLLEKNVDLELRNDCLETALHECITYNKGPILSELLANKERIGPVINAKNDKGNTALHLAADLMELEGSQFVKALLDAGCDINSTNIEKETPLHVAVRRNRLETVKVLIRHKPDLNIIDKFGERSGGPYNSLIFSNFEKERETRKEISSILLIANNQGEAERKAKLAHVQSEAERLVKLKDEVTRAQKSPPRPSLLKRFTCHLLN